MVLEVGGRVDGLETKQRHVPQPQMGDSYQLHHQQQTGHPGLYYLHPSPSLHQSKILWASTPTGPQTPIQTCCWSEIYTNCLARSNTDTHKAREMSFCVNFRDAHMDAERVGKKRGGCKGHSAWCEAVSLRAPFWQPILHCESHLHSSHISPPAAADHCVTEAYHDGYT